MTPADLKAALKRLGLTQAQAADRWSISLRTLNAWCAGQHPVPTWIAHLIALEEGATKPLRDSR